jgi:hypothetical protein
MPINTGTGSATIRLDSIGAVTRHSGAIEAAQSTPRDGFGTWVGQAAVARSSIPVAPRLYAVPKPTVRSSNRQDECFSQPCPWLIDVLRGRLLSVD